MRMRGLALCLLVLISSGNSFDALASQESFADDFSQYPNGSDGSPTWLPVKGNWRVVNGVYRQLSPEYDCAAMFGEFITGSFEIRVRFRIASHNPGAGLFFNSENRHSTRFSHMVRFESPSTILLGYFDEGNYHTLQIAHFPAIDLDQWHVLRLRVDQQKESFDLLLDGQAVAQGVPLKYRAGYWGLQSSAGETWFDDVLFSLLGGEPSAPEFCWAREFDVRDGQIYAPLPHRARVGVYSLQGKLVRLLGIPASDKGWLRKPVAVATDEVGVLYVADAGAQAVHKMDGEGNWMASVGWQGDGPGQFHRPCALAVSGSKLFVVDRGNHRIQVFDTDLRYLDAFGANELRDPVDVATAGDTVAVLDGGNFRVFLYRWEDDGHRAELLAELPSGYTHPRAISWGRGGLYVSRGNEVVFIDLRGQLQTRFEGWGLRGIVPWGSVWDGQVLWVVDYGAGRILRLRPDLHEVKPQIRFPHRDRAEIQWRSDEPVAATARVFRGAELIAEKIETRPSVKHKMRVDGLQPSTVYHVEITPVVDCVPKMRRPSRRFPFVAPPAKGQTHYVRLPAVAIIFANVLDPRRFGPNGEKPPLLPESEISRIVKQVYDGAFFYWMNSGMKFFLDVDTIVVREPVQRSDLFANLSYYPPAEGKIEEVLQKNGKDPSSYRAVFYIACIQKWLEDEGRWELAGRGGAFTSGLGANGKYGVSWWEATRAHHFSGNNWLVVHEFHHQLDELFMLSGYPEYWFNHFSPTIGTSADFGEHFDGNAYLLRHWPADFWFDLKYAEICTAADADEDGIPDDAPRLPMDERRLRSSPDRRDTDGDGVSDLREIAFSNWVVEGVEETYGGGHIFPNLVWRDTDGDGLSDGKDPAPLTPVVPVLLPGTPEIDGRLTPGEWRAFGQLKDVRINADMYAQWDSSALYLAFDLERPVPFKVMVDADADGWFLGKDNLRIDVEPDSIGQPRVKLRVQNCAEPERWPFDDPELARKLEVVAKASKSNGRWWVEVALMRSPEVGLLLKQNESIGLLFGFLVPFDKLGHKRYVDLFEPNRLFDVTLKVQ